LTAVTPGADQPLTDYCEHVIRFIAAQMLDPHRHFEQGLLGQLALAGTPDQRLGLLRQLLDWLGSDQLLAVGQRERLDAELAARQWPGTGFARQHPEVAVAWLQCPRSAAARERLRQALDNGTVSRLDRDRVQRLLQPD
jgi:hypothetical protein